MDNNNYNYKTNPKPISSDSIGKYKDFDALLKRVEAAEPPPKTQLKVASKRAYYWIGSIAAALLIGFLAFNTLLPSSNNYEQQANVFFAAQPYVNPPIRSLAQKPETITVDANEGGVYKFPSGSRMVVPKAAFANSYGSLIEGDVEIHFKEYHDYVDFFLSGIPMEIDINGKEHILESAGMIEVYAMQDGERLQMIPEKPIDIELKSQIAFAGDTPPEFNIYYLDEEKREWDLRGKDAIEIVNDQIDSNTENYRIKVIGDPDDPNFTGKITFDTVFLDSPEAILESTLKELDKKLETSLAQAERSLAPLPKPQKPEQYDGNSMTFELDFKRSDLGAKNYEGTIFQVLGTEAIDEVITSTIWKEFNLNKQADDSFVLELKKDENQAELKVKPVLTGRDFDNALQQFEAQLAEYQESVQERKTAIVAKKKAIADRIALEKEMANKSFAEKMEALKAKGHNNYATNEMIKRTVVNRFQINRFGVWNADKPLPPYLAVLDGTFSDQHLKKYEETLVYQTDKSANTVRRFYLKDIAKVQYNHENDNLLWILTEENKLAVFTPQNFEKVTKQLGEYDFDMTLKELPINSEEDVRSILEL